MNIKRLGLFLLIILLVSLNNSIYALDEKDYNDTNYLKNSISFNEMFICSVEFFK